MPTPCKMNRVPRRTRLKSVAFVLLVAMGYALGVLLLRSYVRKQVLAALDASDAARDQREFAQNSTLQDALKTIAELQARTFPNWRPPRAPPLDTVPVRPPACRPRNGGSVRAPLPPPGGGGHSPAKRVPSLDVWLPSSPHPVRSTRNTITCASPDGAPPQRDKIHKKWADFWAPPRSNVEAGDFIGFVPLKPSDPANVRHGGYDSVPWDEVQEDLASCAKQTLARLKAPLFPPGAMPSVAWKERWQPTGNSSAGTASAPPAKQAGEPLLALKSQANQIAGNKNITGAKFYASAEYAKSNDYLRHEYIRLPAAPVLKTAPVRVPKAAVC